MFSTLFFPILPNFFDSLKNIGKPLFFWCFQGDQKKKIRHFRILHSMFSTLFFPILPNFFDSLKNIGKPLFLWCFQGDQKETLRRKGLNPCETSIPFLIHCKKIWWKSTLWWFIIDTASNDQYSDIVAPPSAGNLVPVPTLSSVKNGRS